MDVGGKPAESLSNFYAATLALVLQASVETSAEKFDQAIANVWTVREAWRQVASDPDTPERTAAELQKRKDKSGRAFSMPQERPIEERHAETCWTA